MLMSSFFSYSMATFTFPVRIPVFGIDNNLCDSQPCVVVTLAKLQLNFAKTVHWLFSVV